MAVVLCETSYIIEPTEFPWPTIFEVETTHDHLSTAIVIEESVAETTTTTISTSIKSVDTGNANNNNTNNGIIIGSSVGGSVLLICIFGGMIYFIYRQRQKQDDEYSTDDGSSKLCDCLNKRRVPDTSPATAPSAPALGDDVTELQEVINRRKTWTGASENGPPKEFMCPISFDLMEDPVMVKTSGWTYERQEIERWVNENGNDPNTREPCSISDLIPNRTLRDAIAAWKKDVGYVEQ